MHETNKFLEHKAVDRHSAATRLTWYFKSEISQYNTSVHGITWGHIASTRGRDSARRLIRNILAFTHLSCQVPASYDVMCANAPHFTDKHLL